MALISAFQQGFVPGLIYLLSLMLAMCVAVSFHEYAHAVVANKLGDPTAKNMGRMTLDPTKHIDLIGLLCFVLLGIGWAKPVIVNSRNLKHFKRDDILISIAGPVMNLLLSFIFYGIWFFGTFQWSFAANDVVQQILSMLFSLNICFAVFNILPIPPLDGFHVVTSLFVRKNYRVVEVLQRYGFIILILLLASGFLTGLLNIVTTWLEGIYSSFFLLFL